MAKGYRYAKPEADADYIPSSAGDDLLATMWARGDTLKDIGAALGVSDQTVSRRRVGLGLPDRETAPRFVWSDEADARAKPLYESGIGAASVAMEMGGGCTAKAISSRASKKGWRSSYDPALAKPKKINPAKSRNPAFKPRAPGPTAKIMADHKSGECIFPVGKTDAHRADLQLFCCLPRAPAWDGERQSDYCLGHAKIAFPNFRKGS